MLDFVLRSSLIWPVFENGIRPDEATRSPHCPLSDTELSLPLTYLKPSRYWYRGGPVAFITKLAVWATKAQIFSAVVHKLLVVYVCLTATTYNL